MKLGIGSAVWERGKWGEDKFARLKDLGFSCIDYDMAQTEHFAYALPEEEAKEKLKELLKEIKAAGLSVSQIHGPWRWPPQDGTEEERAERMEIMKKSIRMTPMLDCKYWVVHALMPFGIQDKGTDKEAQTWQINLAFMRELLSVAKECGVTICLENMPMPEFSIGTPGEVLKFVKEIDDPNFKICLDTGHVAVYRGASLADAVREVGKELRVLHVHDNNGVSDFHWLPYFGVSDWAGFSDALHEIGFDGVLSFETNPPASMPPAVYNKGCELLAEIGKSLI